jgi:hypothetical protein
MVVIVSDEILRNVDTCRVTSPRHVTLRYRRWSESVPGKDILGMDKLVFSVTMGDIHWVCVVAITTEKRKKVYDSKYGIFWPTLPRCHLSIPRR